MSTTRVHPVHTAPGPLADALATLPSWTAARDRLAALEAVQVPSDGLPATINDRVAGLIEATLSENRPDTSELLSAVVAARARFEGEQLLSSVANGMREDAVTELDEALAAGADHLLGHIHNQLSELLSEATEVARALGSVSTAEQAIAADKVTAWQRLDELRAGYVAIRRAQNSVFQRTSSQTSSVSRLAAAYLENPAEVDSDFVARRVGQPVRYQSGEGWESREPKPAPWPDLAQPEALDWFAAHPEARAWVPTQGELARAEEQIARAGRDFVAEQRGVVTGGRSWATRTGGAR
jgi:hypothetical protein